MLDYFKSQQDHMVALLTDLINHETFSTSKAHVDQLTDYLADVISRIGTPSIIRLPKESVGDGLIVRWNETAPGKPILFLMHIDTVWPIGTLAERPVTIDDEGRLYGPGSFDMKGGVTVALTAVRGLHEQGALPNRPIWMLITTDEEIGSKDFDEHIKEYAAGAALVLVTEPSIPGEIMKVGRKGVGHYRVEAHGKPAHAGNEPEQGINAAIEIVQQALEVHQLNDLRHGTSVSVTMLEAGSAGNVIPEHASMTIDVRALTVQAYTTVHDAIMNLQPKLPGAKLSVYQDSVRVPMEFNDQMQADFKRAQEIGAELGLTVRGDVAGGGSDGNLTASMGIPTLDGLGPDGSGPHALHEHVLVASLPRRAALVAGILRDWPNND